MKKALIIILCPFLSAIFYGCEEFMEKDITGKKVTLLAPVDSLVTSNTTITFWWEEVDGALDYSVQVVSPDFERVEKLWVDSFVVGNKLELALVPGRYQWRIKGWNGSSETQFTTASFVIDSTLNLTTETVVLLSPTNQASSNKPAQIFKWNNLYNADEYRFTLTNQDNTLLKDEVTRNTENTFEFTEDGSYVWSVRGQNNISNTLYSSYTLVIDTESPGIPTLKLPLNESALTTTTEAVRFEWTRAQDSGSSLFDSLYIFSDVDLTQRVLSRKTAEPFYEEDSLESGVYWWYVITCDAAGNTGKKSSVFKFTKSY
jgi:hypothetical protein